MTFGKKKSRGTEDYLAWGANVLIQTPPPRVWLIPAAIIAVILSVALVYSVRTNVIDSVRAPGRIVLKKNTPLKAMSNGVVSNVFVRAGSEVQLGQPVARIGGARPIISPESGVLFRKFVEVGSVVNADDVVAMIGDPSGLWIARLDVSERDFQKLKEGQDIRVRLVDQPDVEPIQGKLTEYLSPSSQQPAMPGGAFIMYLADLHPNETAKEWLKNNGPLAQEARVEALIYTGQQSVYKKIRSALYAR